MTLDDARAAFEESAVPDREDTWACAVDYLVTATEYWTGGMISDETFSDVVKKVAPYIAS